MNNGSIGSVEVHISDWEKTLATLLSCAKYAFPGGAVLDDELKGFCESIRSFCSDQRKKSFFLGYKYGASDCLEDVKSFDPEMVNTGGADNFTFDPQLAEQGAWKRWAEVNK